MQIQRSCEIFNTTFNPNGVRTGNKILRQRLKGQALLDYYPRRAATIKDMRRMWPDMEFPDEHEEQRVAHVEKCACLLRALALEICSGTGADVVRGTGRKREGRARQRRSGRSRRSRMGRGRLVAACGGDADRRWRRRQSGWIGRGKEYASVANGGSVRINVLLDSKEVAPFQFRREGTWVPGHWL